MNPDTFFRTIGLINDSRAEMRLRHQMNFLYRNIDFSNRNVLDIGGGIGLHSFYALARGAKSTVIIEPEGDGGHTETINKYNKLCESFTVNNISLIQSTFQNFQAPKGAFDIILIQDAINHFDETACISLRESNASRQVYHTIFQSIAELIRPGGTLILSDCSSINLYPMLNMKNPFDLNIEWIKHQPPKVWIELANANGFEQTDLRWSTPARFGKIGQLLFGNAFSALFFTSHFVITFKRAYQ